MVENCGLENPKHVKMLAREAKEKYEFTDVYEDIVTKENIVTISKAIIRNEEFKGVFCIDFSSNSIAHSIGDINYGEKGILSYKEIREEA